MNVIETIMEDSLMLSAKMSVESNDDPQYQNYIAAGNRLSHAPIGEEIVITGIAGCFPKSNNIVEFCFNIDNQIDMLSSVDDYWKITNPLIPNRIGKINFHEKFDSGFFGVHHHQAEAMDQGCRKLLEHSIEAITDAGYNYLDLQGCNVGVYIGTLYNETELFGLYDHLKSPHCGITGCARNSFAHRISYHLGLQGPSVSVDSACSGSLYALDHAYRAIKTGRCDSALVGGTNLLLNGNLVEQFFRLGVLDPAGNNNVFEEGVKGYLRSEAISVIYLEKSKDAKRIYAQIVHAKTNCDGYKEEQILFPSKEMEWQLMDDVYKECQIDPGLVNFVESHCTGTRAGVSEETAAIEEIFCKDRQTPLLIGSVKSNMGHSECSSGLASLIKVITGMEIGQILPSLNYSKIRTDVDAFNNGKIVVPTERTPLSNGDVYIAINNYGFGGANAHVLLKNCQMRSPEKQTNESRLICVSGRTHEAMCQLFADISTNYRNENYVSLLNEVFRTNIAGHLYRGFVLLSNGQLSDKKACTVIDGTQPRLCLRFNNLINDWVKLASILMRFPVFSETIQKISDELLPKGIDIVSIITGNNSTSSNHILIGTIAVEIAMFEFIKFLELPFDFLVGCSFGNLSSAYADGILTLKQVILIGHQLGCALEAKSGSENDVQGILKLIREDKDYKLQKLHQNPSKFIGMDCTRNGDYFLPSLLDLILSNEDSGSVPSNTTVLNIGSGYLNKPEGLHNVIECIHSNNVIDSLLTSLGKLYEVGFNPKLEKLHQKVSWPIKVPLITPLMKWNHDENWFVCKYKPRVTYGTHTHKITLHSTDWSFLTGHVIDGRIVFPACGYLSIVWDTYLKMVGLTQSHSKVVFEDLNFYKTTVLSRDSETALLVQFQKNSKKFEVTESNDLIVSGKVRTCNDEFDDTENSFNGSIQTLIPGSGFYRAFKLRGYNYGKAFESLAKVDIHGTRALVKWDGNWVAFLDGLMQMKLLHKNSTKLFLPTTLEYLAVKPAVHVQHSIKEGENTVVPVYSNKSCSVLRSTGVDMRGLRLLPVATRRNLAKPILQTYQFVPFRKTLSLSESIIVTVQLVLENIQRNHLRVVEILDESTCKFTPISPNIYESLLCEPLVESEIRVFSKNPVDIPNLTVENKRIDDIPNQTSLVILSGVSNRLHVIHQILNKCEMLLLRENLGAEKYIANFFNRINVISVYQTDSEELILLRKAEKIAPPSVISVNSCESTLDWMPKLQSALNSAESILLLATNDNASGILGFVNCLKHEHQNITCVFVMDESVNINDDVYMKQIEKGLLINVLQNGEWGTYRYLPLVKNCDIESEHTIGVVEVGDLSSFHWIEGPLRNNSELSINQTLAQTYYVGLNFKDVLMSNGSLHADTSEEFTDSKSYALGLEFSGINLSGKRVMGMIDGASMSNFVAVDQHLTWEVPENWSLVDAATVPITYSTVVYALILVAKIKPGQSVLIHAGSGGIGQAAINVALHYDCTIFTTVGTLEKRKLLKELYPSLTDNCIGNSRDTSFEQLIMKQTKGNGVDIVLNSLSEDKLRASLRCLAYGGKFLEIGKYDINKNNPFDLALIANRSNFYSIQLDKMSAKPEVVKQRLATTVDNGIKDGFIKTLPKVVYAQDKVTEALRHMGSAKHIGKVVVKIQDENSKHSLIKAEPRFYCDPRGVYVIIEGLGGFGIEFTDWLIKRRAKTIILLSRSGVTTGYQQLKTSLWKEIGISIVIARDDVTTQKGCVELLTKANKLGYVDGIFNFAEELNGSLFKNQTPDSFLASLKPKTAIIKNIDIISREMCPYLRYFVVFSSLISGRGIVGQTNYGMGNSAMERICEKRKLDGYPALAIQWGFIADETLLVNTAQIYDKKDVGEAFHQRITSCLEVMDTLLNQGSTIVSSFVMDEKKTVAKSVDLFDEVKEILGIKSLKAVSQQYTMAQLGMDSIASVELKKLFERVLEASLSPRDLRNMNLAKLEEIHRSKSKV